jgi:phage FluMu gp28-like protein
MDIKTGDEVRVKPPSTRYRKHSAEGYAGRVTKVARKYATAEYEHKYEDSLGEHTRTTTIEFEIATGRERYCNTNHPTYVYTPEAIELKNRAESATAAIKDSGLEFRIGHQHDFPLECLEALAAVLRDHGMVS